MPPGLLHGLDLFPLLLVLAAGAVRVLAGRGTLRGRLRGTLRGTLRGRLRGRFLLTQRHRGTEAEQAN